MQELRGAVLIRPVVRLFDGCLVWLDSLSAPARIASSAMLLLLLGVLWAGLSDDRVPLLLPGGAVCARDGDLLDRDSFRCLANDRCRSGGGS